MGEFDPQRVLKLLRDANTDSAKLTATEKFLAELEDYDAAMKPNSKSSRYFRALQP